jgi:hypothetical protein
MVAPLYPLGQPQDLPIKVAPHETHVNGGLLALPGGSPADAVRAEGGDVFALSNGSLYRLSDGAWKSVDISSEASGHHGFRRMSANVQLLMLAAWNREDGQGAAPDVPVQGLPSGADVTDIVAVNNQQWIGTSAGLFLGKRGRDPERQDAYGVGGPLATHISALAGDAEGNLWVGTPLGLSKRTKGGEWFHIQGKQGLPYEDITSIVVNGEDQLWIGTTHGVIHYRPDDADREWFYREGPRYVADNAINGVAVSEDGKTVYVATSEGVNTIELKTTTLLEKANNIEARVNERHRRRGLVGQTVFESADDLTKYRIPDSDNDGLWTAYHVTAMALAYGTTKDPAYRESAKTGMDSLYMLQNASGKPGLVARSVLPLDLGKAHNDAARARGAKRDQWRLTPDEQLYWKSDTSSDEYCGHYMAFYAYWEHIARRGTEEEKALHIKQVRDVTDYMIEGNYQLIDWTGERTRWGFWNPENLNNDPSHYIENGLNALQVCSFLKVAYYVTGDQKYQDHYLKLLVEHDYLSNIMTEKKTFPDELNHSDDQLGFTAWFPILQLEHDPKIRHALNQGVRRHWVVEERELPSYFTFIYATIDPNHADIDGAIQNLKEIPEDRRSYKTMNSQRTDVVFEYRNNRFDRPVITRALPSDERNFEKWNQDPFEPDDNGNGLSEDPGSAYLLPYWMGRYYGFFTEDE